jgi:hypothetical protein
MYEHFGKLEKPWSCPVAKVFNRVYAIWTRRSGSANCSPENANLKKGNNSFIKFPKYIKIFIW